jgi:hypothetical protein
VAAVEVAAEVVAEAAAGVVGVVRWVAKLAAAQERVAAAEPAWVSHSANFVVEMRELVVWVVVVLLVIM